MKKSILIASTVIAAAGLFGYIAGRISRVSLPPAVMHWQMPEASDDLLSSAGNGTLSDPAARHVRVKKLKERFHTLWSSAEYRHGDWETRRECQLLLAELGTDELAEYCRASADDRRLRSRLLDEWVQRDGPAAMETALHLFSDRTDVHRTMWAWSLQKPEASLDWLREVQMPAHFADSKPHFRVNLLMDLATKDFSRPEKELPYMQSTEKEWLFKRLAQLAGTDPEKTARVKELSAQYSPASAAEIAKAGFRAMVAQDPEAAAKHLESMDLTGSARTEMETAYLEGMSNRGLTEAYQAWISVRDSSAPIPESVWRQVDSAFIFQPDKTKEWLDAFQPGPERDAIYARSIQHLAVRGNHDHAAAYISMIEDSTLRGAALKTLQRLWNESNAEAAKSWQSKLSAADRQVLQP